MYVTVYWILDIMAKQGVVIVTLLDALINLWGENFRKAVFLNGAV